MPKPTKKVGGLFRRLIWQRLPWFWKLPLLVGGLAMAVYTVEWLFR